MIKIIFKDKRMEDVELTGTRGDRFYTDWDQSKESDEWVNLGNGIPQFRFADVKFCIKKPDPKPKETEPEYEKGITMTELILKHPEIIPKLEMIYGKKWDGENKRFVKI